MTSIISLLVVFILGLFIRDFFPGYMKQKGVNLATKEDIQDITRKTEEVKQTFQQEIATFSNELTFRNDFAFQRYSKLYTEVYAIIIQSEYVRFFYQNINGEDLSFEEFPFFEIQSSEVKTVSNLFTGNIKTEEIKNIVNDLTSANKKALYEFIIKNRQYASPELLKLAVSYRFVHNNYSGTKKRESSDMASHFDISELALSVELVKTIVREYNELRKTVKLSYNDIELHTGKIDHSLFK